MRTIRQQARLAGLLYFLLGITAPIGLEIVPNALIVSGNATATADHLRASGFLLRIGIASELFHQVMVIFVVLALFRLFRAISEALAWQVVILGALVSVPIMFVNVLNEIAALILVGGADYLSVFSKSQLDALAYLFIRLHGQGINIVEIFWGLWLFPFGLLVVRSGFIPRIFGYLLMIAGVAYVIDSTVTLLWPQYSRLVGQYTLIPEICEVPIIFWLLIWGAKGPQADQPVA